jgi:hypothetical protein
MHCSRVDAFRHRAALIIADPARPSHGKLWLTLTGPARQRELQSMTQKAVRAWAFYLKMSSFSVMAGLVPAIHVFLAAAVIRRGCPGQARA